jgi:hypothetical protein
MADGELLLCSPPRLCVDSPRELERGPVSLLRLCCVSIALCAHCGGPVATYASMCPRCGHRASSRGAVMVGGIPVYGSRRRGPLGRMARRMATALLVGAGVGAVFLLSHLYRTPSAHEADDQEGTCRAIQESNYEEHPGELADCFARLSRLRAAERREAPPTRTLDSVRPSP